MNSAYSASPSAPCSCSSPEPSGWIWSFMKIGTSFIVVIGGTPDFG